MEQAVELPLVRWKWIWSESIMSLTRPMPSRCPPYGIAVDTLARGCYQSGQKGLQGDEGAWQHRPFLGDVGAPDIRER